MGAEVGGDTPAIPAEVAARMFERDRASGHLGIELTSVAIGHAVLTMTVTDELVNGLGVCHGGFLFTLADSAMAFATNAGDQRAFATHADIDFVNPATLGTRLTATATTVVARNKTSVVDVQVTDEDGATIAVFRGRTLSVGGPV